MNRSKRQQLMDIDASEEEPKPKEPGKIEIEDDNFEDACHVEHDDFNTGNAKREYDPFPSALSDEKNDDASADMPETPATKLRRPQSKKTRFAPSSAAKGVHTDPTAKPVEKSPKKRTRKDEEAPKDEISTQQPYQTSTPIPQGILPSIKKPKLEEKVHSTSRGTQKPLQLATSSSSSNSSIPHLQPSSAPTKPPMPLSQEQEDRVKRFRAFLEEANDANGLAAMDQLSHNPRYIFRMDILEVTYYWPQHDPYQILAFFNPRTRMDELYEMCCSSTKVRESFAKFAEEYPELAAKASKNVADDNAFAALATSLGKLTISTEGTENEAQLYKPMSQLLELFTAHLPVHLVARTAEAPLVAADHMIPDAVFLHHSDLRDDLDHHPTFLAGH